MRCLSPHSNYSIQVFEGVESILTDRDGRAFSHVTRKPTIANFQQGGMLDHELEYALTKFNFSGIPDGVNPLSRISVFDTEVYAIAHDLDPEELEAIDAKLRRLQEMNPSEFIIVDQPSADKPWEAYDEQSVEDVIYTRNLTGINPERVRLYEVEHEARPEIIEAMEALEAERADGGGILVEA